MSAFSADLTLFIFVFMPAKVASFLSFAKYLLIIASITLLKVNVFQVQSKTDPISLEQIEHVAEGILQVTYLSATLDNQNSLYNSWSSLKERAASEVASEIERIKLEEERKKIQEKLYQQAKAKSTKLKHYDSRPARVMGDFETTIRSACNTYGCYPEQLIRVMYCESGGRSNAVNGVYSGLFQFHPNTFRANANRIGLTNADIWNPYHQIQVAAWMFANGQAWQWGCK